MGRQNINNLYDMIMRLLRREATSNLKNLLKKLHPADIAQVVQRFDATRQDKILSFLSDSNQLPEVFPELGSAFLAEYLNRHPDYEALVGILQRMDSDDRADLVGELPEELSTEILSRMKKEESQEVSGLLQYDEETAGGLMSTEVFKLNESTTVAEAIQALQNPKKVATSFYLYIVNEFDQLTGVLSIRVLFQANSETPLKKLMIQDVVCVQVNEPQEEVARVVAQYDLIALPVVDENGKLKGIITVDDVIDVIKEEAVEQVMQVGNAEIEALGEFNLATTLKKRLPWFLILFIGGVLTCEVIIHFYESLPNIAIFAGFIPLILRFGGIISRQSSTIVTQGMAHEQVRPSLLSTILGKQGLTTFFIATLSAILVAGYSYLRFQQMAMFPFAIGLSLFISMMVAYLLGILIPLSFQKIRIDTTWATGLLLNFLLDVLSLFIYFTLLIWIL